MKPNILDRFQEILRHNQARMTEHTRAIFDILEHTPTPLQAKDIQRDLANNHIHIDLSTVHRILDRFQDWHIITPIYRDKATLYELSSLFLPHHHHFTCNICHTIFEIDSCVLEHLEKSVSSIGTVTFHSIELFGMCNKCEKIKK